MNREENWYEEQHQGYKKEKKDVGTERPDVGFASSTSARVFRFRRKKIDSKAQNALV
jgi:hypothetical protein